MAIVFNRKYKLTWGSPLRTAIAAPNGEAQVGKTFVAGEPFPGMVTDPDTPVPIFALSVDDFQMKASLPMNKAKKAGTSDSFTIEVFNLPDSTIGSMLKDDMIILEAGYETDKELPTVFIGSIRKVVTMQKGQDRHTKISCNNDTGTRRGFFASYSWPAGTSYKEMIGTLQRDLARVGLPSVPIRAGFGSGYREVNGLITQTGVSYEGNAIDILDSLCKEVDYRAYIILNTLYIEPITQPEVRQVVELEESNIIGNIEQLSEGGNTLTGQQQVGNGVKFSLFLDGRITPATKVDISFGKFKGTYLVKGVTHKMNYEGKNWLTEVTCDGGQVE